MQVPWAAQPVGQDAGTALSQVSTGRSTTPLPHMAAQSASTVRIAAGWAAAVAGDERRHGEVDAGRRAGPGREQQVPGAGIAVVARFLTGAGSASGDRHVAGLVRLHHAVAAGRRAVGIGRRRAAGRAAAVAGGAAGRDGSRRAGSCAVVAAPGQRRLETGRQRWGAAGRAGAAAGGGLVAGFTGLDDAVAALGGTVGIGGVCRAGRAAAVARDRRLDRCVPAGRVASGARQKVGRAGHAVVAVGRAASRRRWCDADVARLAPLPDAVATGSRTIAVDGVGAAGRAAAVARPLRRHLVVQADRLTGPDRDQQRDRAGIGHGALARRRAGAGLTGGDGGVTGLAGLDDAVAAGRGAVGVGRLGGPRRTAAVGGADVGVRRVRAGGRAGAAVREVGRAGDAVVAV